MCPKLSLSLPLPTWPDITFTNSWIGIKTSTHPNSNDKGITEKSKKLTEKKYSTTEKNSNVCGTQWSSPQQEFFFSTCQTDVFFGMLYMWQGAIGPKLEVIVLYSAIQPSFIAHALTVSLTRKVCLWRNIGGSYVPNK